MDTTPHRKPAPRKERALSFLHPVTSGTIHEAYAQHVASGFRHHNPYFKGDAESLMQGTEENPPHTQTKVIEARHAPEDGGLVAIHSRVRPKPQDRAGSPTAHPPLPARHHGVEMWDLLQPVPE